MITTRQINVNLSKGKLKLRHVSTKGIDAGVRVEPPKEPIKPRGVTSTTVADVADIREKKRRDDIAVEKKLTMKDEKKIAMIDWPKKKPWKEMTDEEKKVAIKERTAKMLATKARKKKEK